MKVNNLPNITQLINAELGLKLIQLYRPRALLYHCIMLPLVVIAGVGSRTDPRPYLQHSGKTITASVETAPPMGCSQATLSKAGIQRSNAFLAGKVLTHLTTNIVLKALNGPVEPSLRLSSNVGHFPPNLPYLSLTLTRSDLHLMALPAVSSFLFFLTLGISPNKIFSFSSWHLLLKELD